MEASFHHPIRCATVSSQEGRWTSFSYNSNWYDASLAYHSHTPHFLATRLAGVVAARLHQVESPLSLSIFATRHHFADNH